MLHVAVKIVSVRFTLTHMSRVVITHAAVVCSCIMRVCMSGGWAKAAETSVLKN